MRFRLANRDEEAADQDVFQMNFSEFRAAIRLIGSCLGVDQHAIESAIRFGDALGNPLLFSRFCKVDRAAQLLHFFEFFSLLSTVRICPYVVTKDTAERVFRAVLRRCARCSQALEK